MGRNGEVGGVPSSSASNLECCMCGDHGLSSELFSCSACGFRSQHKYCSNLYPGAESYNICNWCLTQKDDQKVTKSSENSSHKTTITDNRHVKMKKGKIDDVNRRPIDSRIKKQNKFPPAADRDAPPSSAARKRVTGDRAGIAHRIINKPLFRNKVRRYKLLDEVSS